MTIPSSIIVFKRAQANISIWRVGPTHLLHRCHTLCATPDRWVYFSLSIILNFNRSRRLPHEFVIDVSSAESDHVINQNWYISGLLQIITDTSPEPTTGGITAYDVEPFAISTSSGETLNGGDDVEITVKSTRQIHIESTVISGSGEVTNVVWSQQLSYSNVQTYLNNALTQVMRHFFPEQSPSDLNSEARKTDK